ncbi:IS21 family transposase, partial [Burkholderia stagnalis]
MSGTHITDQQVRLFMNKRKHHTQEVAAAMAGMSVRTARRFEHGAHLPSQTPPRTWRTRPDPFADVWDSEVVPLLRHAPRLKAVTLLARLQEAHPDRFPDSMRRTLERRVNQWRAIEGPSKEIFFPQEHLPGAQGLSDFTDMRDLHVSVAGARFDHRLYHFVLAFSHWEYAGIVDGGESFEALSTGLQNALWQAGGCP